MNDQRQKLNAHNAEKYHQLSAVTIRFLNGEITREQFLRAYLFIEQQPIREPLEHTFMRIERNDPY